MLGEHYSSPIVIEFIQTNRADFNIKSRFDTEILNKNHSLSATRNQLFELFPIEEFFNFWQIQYFVYFILRQPKGET